MLALDAPAVEADTGPPGMNMTVAELPGVSGESRSACVGEACLIDEILEADGNAGEWTWIGAAMNRVATACFV